MPVQSPRVIHGAVTVALRVFAELTQAGWPVPAWVPAALEELRGKVSAKALKACAARFDAESEQHRKWTVGSTMQRYYWATAAAGSVCFLGLPGGDITNTLNKLSYALAHEPERAETWYAEAFAAAADVSAKAVSKKATIRAGEAAALERIAKALGPKGRLVATSGARYDSKGTGTRPALTRLLARHKYPVHKSVLAFDAKFGGLMIPDTNADDDWFDNGPSTIVGAFACLRSEAHVHPDGGRAGLVPVAYTSNDCILFLDAKGAPYLQDTIEDDTAVGLRTTAAGAVAKLFKFA